MRPEIYSSMKYPECGSVVKATLPDGSIAYGCVLKEPLIGFFDKCFSDDLEDLSALEKTPIAFAVWVMRSAIGRSGWPVVGLIDSSTVEHSIQKNFFRQDPISGKLAIVSEDSSERPATFDECFELERAAVWSTEHILERLQSHFRGEQSAWVARLRPTRINES